MDERGAATAVTGLAVGAIVALGFAVLISVLPDALFLEGRWRAVAYLAGALAAPPTVWFLQWIARVRQLDQRATFIWAAAGAMLFDGFAIGFAPRLYGHSGQALAWVASALIFAFASLIIAGQLMLDRNSSPARS